VLLVGLLAATLPVQAQRVEHSLNGSWQFQREGADDWKTVTVPNSFEQHEGVDFDGVGIYERTIPQLALPEDARAILHFQAVATLAEVWFDGKRLGEHLGGWTPFRFDVTELVRASPDTAHVIRVRVDEKVGHNSQGFLPVFAPHFGGIWQNVKLIVVAPTWIDDTRVLAIGDPKTGRIRLDVPLNGKPPADGVHLVIRYRLRGDQVWSDQQSIAAKLDQDDALKVEVSVKDWKYWSPTEANLYEVEITLRFGPKSADLSNGKSAPQSSGNATQATAAEGSLNTFTTRAAFRTIEVDGNKLLLNGRPLAIRGVLNWGYAPPRVAPSIDEDHFRQELQFARFYGFNLMKFCLWVPPKRYLEIADELGMLTWIEYPTWHSSWSPDQLPTLKKEFTEFFRYDRNNPSVVLRSLTCETGPSADLEVIRSLYDLCHEMIPGSVVEDDSSWIGWNRVHDFYDDHPYGNNTTWVATLDRLKDHVNKHGEKPLVLGEAIAADTWVDPAALLRRTGDERPFWLPGFLEGNQQWLAGIRSLYGTGGLDQLDAESKQYALLMRKFQIETYRREVPYGGYVVSVIRDFPFAGMGLLDFLNRPKWPADDWNWHRDTLLILRTESDRRSFTSGQRLNADILVSHFGQSPIQGGVLTTTVTFDSTQDPVGATIAKRNTTLVDQPAGTLQKALLWNPILPNVNKPTRVLVRAELKFGQETAHNEWPIWVLPSVEKHPTVALHESCSDGATTALFGTAVPFRRDADDTVVIARRLDGNLVAHLESGGRVLLLPDGKKASFPLSDEWFLRGAPYMSNHPLFDTIPRQLLIELQHFDLAGPVVPDINYLEQINPVLMLWHNHDIRRVKTHGLMFETRVGKGRLLVSALQHTAGTNSAGRWLLYALVQHLHGGPDPTRALSAATVRHMREKIDEKKIELIGRTWRFRPDPQNVGLANKWHLPSTKLDDLWKDIRIGQAWEGLGYPKLDGWAWYRIAVDIPTEWKGLPAYVSFEGVDDHYELYVNGKLAGSGGDIAAKATAFEERKSHGVTTLINPGETNHIAVRVYDWYGAGGLFRPVTLGTAQIGSGDEIFK
jgi:Glycosyl hydrolases family 2, sugar binding domain/Glycosyl hydrolases family 2, TIM barrel domain